jgi:hypothetical protein
MPSNQITPPINKAGRLVESSILPVGPLSTSGSTFSPLAPVIVMIANDTKPIGAEYPTLKIYRTNKLIDIIGVAPIFKASVSRPLQTIAIAHREAGDLNNLADAIHAISEHLSDSNV